MILRIYFRKENILYSINILRCNSIFVPYQKVFPNKDFYLDFLHLIGCTPCCLYLHLSSSAVTTKTLSGCLISHLRVLTTGPSNLCSRPRCVTEKFKLLSWTMGPECARPGSPEMTPPDVSSLPSWAVPSTRTTCPACKARRFTLETRP